MEQDKAWAPLYSDLADIYKEVMVARQSLTVRNATEYTRAINRIAELTKIAQNRTVWVDQTGTELEAPK